MESKSADGQRHAVVNPELRIYKDKHKDTNELNIEAKVKASSSDIQ